LIGALGRHSPRRPPLRSGTQFSRPYGADSPDRTFPAAPLAFAAGYNSSAPSGAVLTTRITEMHQAFLDYEASLD